MNRLLMPAALAAALSIASPAFAAEDTPQTRYDATTYALGLPRLFAGFAARCGATPSAYALAVSKTAWEGRNADLLRVADVYIRSQLDQVSAAQGQAAADEVRATIIASIRESADGAVEQIFAGVDIAQKCHELVGSLDANFELATNAKHGPPLAAIAAESPSTPTSPSFL